MTKPSILLVDDNAVQAATRCIILERTGSAVLIASSGIEAMEILARPEALHATSLLITDHLMPGMNGPELVRLVREKTATLPVVVVSGLPEAEEEYVGLDVVFRLKPFHPDSLLALVHELIDIPMQRTA